MKKLGFLLAFGAIFFSSCKKDYTCTCTYTVGSVSTSSSNIIPSATQAEANAICKGGEVYAKGGTQTIHCSL